MSTALRSDLDEVTARSTWEELRRFERLDVAQGRAVLEAQQRLFPHPPAALGTPSRRTIDGGLAIFGGRHSDQNYVRGLDPSEPLSEASLEEIESFYGEHRCASTFVLARIPASPLERQLVERGYRVEARHQVVGRSLPCAEEAPDPLRTCRQARDEERDAWASLLMQGFLERPAPIFHAWFVGRAIFESETACFFVDHDETPIATAALFQHDGIAVLSGDATLESHRRQGAQRCSIHRRLDFAASLGLGQAIAHVVADTPSHRNYLRAGFENHYERLYWRRPMPSSERSGR